MSKRDERSVVESNQPTTTTPQSETKSRTRARGLDGRALVRPEERARFVEHIRGMMIRQEWVTGESAQPLADEWQVAHGTVEVYAAEASKKVINAADPEKVRDVVTYYLERALERADANGETERVAKVAEPYARIVGLVQPAGGVQVNIQNNTTLALPDGHAPIAVALRALEAYPNDLRAVLDQIPALVAATVSPAALQSVLRATRHFRDEPLLTAGEGQDDE